MPDSRHLTVSWNWNAANTTTPKSCFCARPRRCQQLPPAEQALDIGQFEFDVSRSAVVALAGIGNRLHLAQERVHFLGFQPPAGADRAITSHGRRNVHEATLQRQ